jgi:hypothetical protein
LNAAQIRTSEASPRRWHNALPLWAADEVRRLSPSCRLVIQAIADSGNRTAAGHIIGAFGGKTLWDKAGVSRRTFWRAITRLEQLGLVVLLSRGGKVTLRLHQGSQHKAKEVQAVNVYGIPAVQGALDDTRVQREMVIMVRQEDRLRRQVVQPGEQATWWEVEALHQGTAHTNGGNQPPPGDTRVVSSCHYPSVKMTLYSSPLPSPLSQKDHGDGGDGAAMQRRKAKPRRGRFHVEAADLEDAASLRALHTRAVTLGLISESEDDRLFFFAAAFHALRVGQDPPALFATVIRKQMRLVISIEDEERGRAIWRDYVRE